MANTLSFDEQFYLTQNPDVAAAVSRGLFANGADHYNQFGRFEARNPNAFFDTAFYLGQYPDVAAAGINPLEHFLNFGVLENRATNETELGSIDTDGNGLLNEFDSAAYLAQYTDVADGIANGTITSAYQHFIQFGQFEGRVATLTDGTTVSGPFSNTGVAPGTGTTFTLTAGVDEFTGTSGNDTFQGVQGTLTVFDNVNGGLGEDTLNLIINNGSAVNVPTGATVSGIEVINVARTTDAAGDIDASGFEGAREFWQTGTDGNINNLAAGQVAGFRGTNGNVGVNYQDGVTTAAIALDNVDPATDVSTFDVSGEGLTTVSVSGSLAGTTEDPESTVLTLTVNADVASTTAEEQVKTVLVDITGNATIDLEAGFSAITTFDASASEGGIYVQFYDLNDLADGTTPAPATALETVLTGSGNDIVVTANQPDGVNIETNDGDDVVYITGADAGFTISTGEGTDVVQVYSGLTNIAAPGTDETLEESFADDIIQITDFDGDRDILAFVTSNAGAAPLEGTGTLRGGAQTVLNNVQLGNIAEAESLFDAVEVAAAATGANAWVSFVFEDSTYVYQNDANAAFDAGDGLIQLVGFTGGLNDSNFLTPAAAI